MESPSPKDYRTYTLPLAANRNKSSEEGASGKAAPTGQRDWRCTLAFSWNVTEVWSNSLPALNQRWPAAHEEQTGRSQILRLQLQGTARLRRKREPAAQRPLRSGNHPRLDQQSLRCGRRRLPSQFRLPEAKSRSSRHKTRRYTAALRCKKNPAMEQSANRRTLECPTWPSGRQPDWVGWHCNTSI